MHIIGELRV
jgi:hypothetical protein